MSDAGNVTDELTGEFRGLKRLFWIYYPEARYVFVKSEVFNRANDVESEERTRTSFGSVNLEAISSRCPTFTIDPLIQYKTWT